MFTLTIATSKGGVGKSTTVANLAAAWAEGGRRVLAVDVDPGFTLTRMLGERPIVGASSFDLLVDAGVAAGDAARSIAPRLDLIPGSRELTGLDLTLASQVHREYRLAAKLEGAPYDVVIIDTPPAGTLATTNALVASDYALAILSCEDAGSLQGVQELRLQLDLLGGGPMDGPALLGVLRTFVDRRSALYRALMAFPEVAELPLLSAEVPLRRALRKSGAAGVPQVIALPDSETACRYRALAEELDSLIQQKEKNNGEVAAAVVGLRAGGSSSQAPERADAAGRTV